MSYNIKGITVTIDANTSKLQSELNKIKSKSAGIDSTMRKLKNSMKFDSSSFKSLATYQDLVSKKMVSLNKQLNLYEKAISDMPNTLKNWQSELTKTTSRQQELEAKMKSGQKVSKTLQKEYDSNAKKIKELSSHIENYDQKLTALNAETEITRNKLTALGREFISTDKNLLKSYYTLEKSAEGFRKFADATKYISIGSAVGLVGAAAAAISFESAWAGVLKTVSGTPEQLQRVNDGLKELATSTSSSYETIAHYAEIAGQMGIATESVVDFTKTITMLGDTTNLVGEDAAQAIAKFANIMVSKAEQSNEYFSRLGSTLVDLGNNFATTENDIMEMSMRLAVAGKQAGMNSQEILALSTALSSLGIKAAEGGGAMSKLIKQIELAVATGENLNMYAQTAGMTADEFAKAWGDNAANAFTKFIAGIGKAENVTAKLAELGIEEIRMSKATGALAQSTEVFTSALQTANSAFDSNTAMTIEAERRYSTLKSTLSQTWEAIKQAGNELGQAVTPQIKDIANSVKEAAQWFSQLDDETQKNIANLLLIGAAISPVSKGLSLLSSGGAKLIKTFNGSNQIAKALAKGLNLIDTSSQNGSVSIIQLASAFSSSNNKAKLLSTGLKEGTKGIASMASGFASAHPILLGVTAAMGLLTTGVIWASAKQRELTESVRETMETQNANYMASVKVVEGYEAYSSKMEDLTRANTDLANTQKANIIESESLLRVIEQLNSQEELNSSKKTLMAESVERLNSIYPELNLQIDENTGKLKLGTDQTYQNIEAIHARISALKTQAQEEVTAQSIINTTKALAETTALYEQQKQSILDLTTQKQQLLDKMAEENDYSAESATQVQLLTEQINQLNEQYGVTSEKMQQLIADQAYYENYLETKDYSVLGQGLITQLQAMQDKAAETGWKIPETISSAIANPESIESVNQATQLLASMTTYTDLIAQSGIAGGLIPQEIANSMINNSGTLQGAINTIDSLMKFTVAIQNAQASGKEINVGLATQLANDAGIVGSSADKLAQEVVKNIEKGGDDSVTDVQKSNTEMAKAFDNSGVPSSASSMASKARTSMQSSWAGMVTDASNASARIQQELNNARAAAAKPVTITIEKTEVPGKKNIPMPTMMVASESMRTPRLSKDYELSSTIRTTLSSRQKQETSISGMSQIKKLSDKLDGFIDSFKNAKLQVVLEPMEINGEPITDVVVETMQIREILDNLGKGE